MTNRKFDSKLTALLAADVILLSAAPTFAQYGPVRGGIGTGTTVIQPLTETETQWLTFMREEEKLARDVYQKLNEKWNLAVFANISISEQRHYDTIGQLLTRYGVADPAANKDAGVYSDAKLNSLYSELMTKGLSSVDDALQVGILIETKDIEDLETALKGTTKYDLKRAFTNLMNGSYKHLDAFESGCSLTGSVRAGN